MIPKVTNNAPVHIKIRKLLWRHLRALNELYEKRRTGTQVLDNAYVEHLRVNKKLMVLKPGNSKILVPQKGYTAYYEHHHKADFERYRNFLAETDLPSDGTRVYTEVDLLSLMLIHENREIFKQDLTTVNSFSADVFHSAKYLATHQSVYAAVCKILNIEQFPSEDPKSHQWRLVVDCLKPQAVVLCENMDYLKLPWQARDQNLELWYVGGNNIGILEYIADEKLQLPLYYSCDWDYAGLQIYSRVKAKMRDKGKHVTLLLPHDIACAEPVDTPPHKSKWEGGPPFSKIAVADFTESHLELIRYLVIEDLWIEEETQDLIAVLRRNGVLPLNETVD